MGRHRLAKRSDFIACLAFPVLPQQRSGFKNALSISQKNMTTPYLENIEDSCPAGNLLKLLAGKWKAQIFRLALNEPLRFNRLLRQLPGSNKQSVAVALKELEEADILQKTVVQEKPLHIEYSLTERGLALVPVFRSLEALSGEEKAD